MGQQDQQDPHASASTDTSTAPLGTRILIRTTSGVNVEFPVPAGQDIEDVTNFGLNTVSAMNGEEARQVRQAVHDWAAQQDRVNRLAQSPPQMRGLGLNNSGSNVTTIGDLEREGYDVHIFRNVPLIGRLPLAGIDGHHGDGDALGLGLHFGGDHHEPTPPLVTPRVRVVTGQDNDGGSTPQRH